jgi:ribonuclease P protein component
MPEDPRGLPDRGLSRRQRLTRSALFAEAYAQGRKGVSRTLVMYLREGEGASLRLGVVSSRKVGKAPYRNRARRLMREAWRLNRHRFYGDVDVVLIARAAAARARFSEVEEDLLGLARKAGLLKP